MEHSRVRGGVMSTGRTTAVEGGGGVALENKHFVLFKNLILSLKLDLGLNIKVVLYFLNYPHAKIELQTHPFTMLNLNYN